MIYHDYIAEKSDVFSHAGKEPQTSLQPTFLKYLSSG